MKLVILAYAFAPSIGGIETATLVLAEQFHDAGHDVTVITASPDSAGSFSAPYVVVRNPSRSELFTQLKNADAIIQNNISLNFAWPLYLARILKPFGILRSLATKPLVTVLHTYVSTPEGAIGWQHKLKLFSLRYSSNYAVSDHLRRTLKTPCGVMPNPYANQIFRIESPETRTRPLLFVGRLTAAKGCDLAIGALGHLHRTSPTLCSKDLPHLDIVGIGPDEPMLRQLAIDLGIGDYVRFLGPQQGPMLARTMNEHMLLLVPSRSCPPEALGIVALEGIACGCVPIVSEQGGLPEAIGPCGMTFPEGDTEALASRIKELLDDPEARAHFQAASPEHLKQYTPANVAASYHAALRHEGLRDEQNC
jgi:glycogen synthase